MAIENRIRKATCRVDQEGRQQGSAFWVSDNMLISAAHVLNQSQKDDATVRTFDGEVIDCDIEHINVSTIDNSGTDLALLSTDEVPEDFETLEIDQRIPTIGTEVIWSGYARLLGESKMERQRFSWGRVASTEYGKGDAQFFEVDGLFNPGHSGGPIISKDTEQVVGVVSASAGAFDNLEDAWNTRSKILTDALDLYRLVQESSDTGVFNTLTTADPVQGAQIQHTLDRIGMEYNATTENGKISVKFRAGEIPGYSGVILGQMSDLLLDTARNTFQMGVGIASGGSALTDLVQ